MYEDNKKVIEDLTGLKVIAKVKCNDSDIEINTNIFKEV